MLRTFIALDFPEAILQKADKIISYFKGKTPPRALRWVAIDNLHLTIKFLGDVPENNIDQIKSTIIQTVKRIPPCQISVRGFGMYPDARRPRVVWLGIDHDAGIINLHDALDGALTSINIKPEKRPFSPHLTIARVSRRADEKVVKSIGATLSKFKVDSLGSMTIQEVVLYKSDLTPKGPIYAKLLSAPLDKV